MAVYFVTGKLGGGKSLVTVGKIKDYILAGKPVATNLDLFLEYLIPKNISKIQCYRVPDKPSLEDLKLLGYGNYSADESKNGLLVLDELGTWLNARTYQDKGRQEIIDWLLHARKFGWDVMLIVQNVDLLDKQVRVALGEHTVVCRRTDRIPLPIVGWVFKLFTGFKIPLPRVHVGSVFYGEGQGAIKIENWVYRGNDLFKGYDTKQIFKENYNRLSSYLPPASLNLKRFSKKNMGFYMRLTKIYWKKFRVPLAFASGLFLNFIFLAVLLTVSGFSGHAKVEKEPKIVKNEKINPELAGVSEPKTEIRTERPETVLTKIPYIVETNGNLHKYTFLLGGRLYSLSSFPYSIEWINSKPYYYAPLNSN